MDNKILRIIVDANQFCALEECDPLDFADHYEDYFKYMRETLSKKYKVPCIVEYCSGGRCAVEFRCDGDKGYKLGKQVFEEYASDDAGVISFSEFVDNVEGV
ncbi:MAG: hypothetical protein GY777_24790 [Candidatus Brocadiaceae bacterium]|nr:hypothetical protein [Candidatus Brocadiaceae bacterium]